jgi:phosphoadenosine phosphosulfate reductase
MRKAVSASGYRLVIRGQKNADVLKGPLRSGHVDEDGVEYWFPLEDWTDADVRRFIADQAEIALPDYYRYTNSSLDCWSCTAYLPENIGKRRYMAKHHPIWHDEVTKRLQGIAGEIAREAETICKALGQEA